MNDDIIKGILLERRRRARIIERAVLLVLYSALAVAVVFAVAAS